jgi:hypothetical protein
MNRLDHRSHPREGHVKTVRDDSGAIELRQYTLHPGKRDTLIDLFESRFLQTQEALGIRILGQFRDADGPDRFVWLRGYRDMAARAETLTAFYDGPVFRAHRNAANATMIDSDDVLLLRPMRPDSGFVLLAERADATAASPGTLVVANVWVLSSPLDEAFESFFEATATPLLVETGAAPIAVLRSEYDANNFPRHPIREGEHVLVWFASFASVDEHGRHVARLRESRPWRDVVEPELDRRLTARSQRLRLQPTAASRLRHVEG